MTPTVQITADEINCLVYAYLQDSGFQHSSFALRTEGRLDLSPHAKTPIRRGELVDLLTKALLYTEVETHWKLDTNAGKCAAPFSLLIPHVCSVRAPRRQQSPASVSVSPRPELFPSPRINGTGHDTGTVQKRKASPKVSVDNRAEKRLCTSEDVEMRVDEPESAIKTHPSKTANHVATKDEDMEQDTQPLAPKVEETTAVQFQYPVPFRLPKIVEPISPVILLQGHEAEVFSAAWNPAHPNLLATGSKDATVRIWSWEDIKTSIRDHVPPDSPFSTSPPASQYSRPGPAILRHQPKSDQPDITSLDWNVDGTLLATGSYDRLLRIWKKSGEPYMTQIYHSGPIFSVQFSKTGKWLLSASLDGTACVWDVATKRLQMRFKVHTSCLDVDWLDESTFATCSANRAIHIVSLSSGQAIRTFVGHTNEVNQVKFNKHKTILASCSDDNTARIWLSDAWTNPDGSIASAEVGLNEAELAKKYPAKFVLSGHTNSVGAIRWCPTQDGTTETLLATCSFDKTARLWDASRGTCLRVFTENTKPLFSITFSPEGRFVATGSEDGYLYIYNAATGNKVWRWPATGPGAGPIYDVNWQKLGGRRLAMCMKSKIVGIVDTTRIPGLAPAPDESPWPSTG